MMAMVLGGVVDTKVFGTLVKQERLLAAWNLRSRRALRVDA